MAFKAKKKIENPEKIADSGLNHSTFKNCPICKEKLHSAVFYNAEIDYCPKCLGIWFDEDELRQAKDAKDKSLKWLDIDLWEDRSKFKISYGIMRLCPNCRMPLYELYYADSRIIVDACGTCRGVWLDRAEFKKIIEYLREKSGKEVIRRSAKNLIAEMAEIFSGPESLREEIGDFLTILKLISYKFSATHPVLSQLMLDLPK